jgi:hypothetical protein
MRPKNIMTTSDTPNTTSCLPGYIYCYFRGNIEYANYETYIYDDNHKSIHYKEYLGEVKNYEEKLFYSTKYGFFNFTLAKGYVLRPELSDNLYAEKIRLRYGDLWVYNETLRSTGLDIVTNNLIPEYKDTLNALLCFRLSLKDSAFCNAQTWYDRSFAKVIYPKAALSSGSISLFLKN